MHGPGVHNVGDNKNITDQDGNVLKLKEENSSLLKKVSGEYITSNKTYLKTSPVNYMPPIFPN